ncbi:MAG: futalosine hydrolase [Prevotellaceae bacterium]|jgi:futalosine hydrolase|nr:futalosine hydrolase [Prevotellaceae bacterium]
MDVGQNILVVAATAMELQVVQKALVHHAGVEFAAIGVGALATAYSLTSLLKEHKFELALNVGIAGTFYPKFELGSAVVVEQEKLADFGVASAQGFQDIFTAGLINGHSAPFMHGVLHCPCLKDFPALKDVPKVKGLTVSTLLEEDVHVRKRASLYGAEIETMEGAAFFYVCLQESVRFLQLRGISNVVGMRDKSKWKITEALESIVEVVKSVVV